MNKKLASFIIIILISKNIFADILLSEVEKSNAINLNRDFSFNIPVIKHVNPDGTTSYYNVNFIFVPRENKLLFEVVNVVEMDSSEISIEDIDTSVMLNLDLSFNVPAIKHEAIDESIHFYNANFIFVAKKNKLIFQAVDIIEILNSNEPPSSDTADTTDTPDTPDTTDTLDTPEITTDITSVILYEAEQSLLPEEATGACSNIVDIETRASIIREDHYSLTSQIDNLPSSLMSYCEDNIDNNGAAFVLEYDDPNPGEGGMDAYPNGTIGGIQNNGDWFPGQG